MDTGELYSDPRVCPTSTLLPEPSSSHVYLPLTIQMEVWGVLNTALLCISLMTNDISTFSNVLLVIWASSFVPWLPTFYLHISVASFPLGLWDLLKKNSRTWVMAPLLVAYVVWVTLSRLSFFVAFSTHKDAFKLGGISKREILCSWEILIWYVLRKFPVCDKLLWQKETGEGRKGLFVLTVWECSPHGRRVTVPGTWGGQSHCIHSQSRGKWVTHIDGDSPLLVN